MAKQITQESFDAVVKENIEEFEMTAEKAIEDAVSQFEAQGVNLASIVKDLSLHDSAGHPVIVAITNISNGLESDLDDESMKSLLGKMQSECDIDLAHRVLAGKNNGYATLIKALEKYTSNDDMLYSTLRAFCSLCHGQPDLVDTKGMELIQGILKEHSSNPKCAALLVKLIRHTCVMHETNRQAYVSNDIITQFMSTLETHQHRSEVVKEVCFALRVLTFDDDPRVPFGKAHDHAKLIVTEADALRKILNICKDYVDDKAVLGELFLTLSRLAVRNEFCQEIMDLGGLNLMLTALEKNISHQAIVIQAMIVMKAIAGNDKVKIATVRNNGVELILDSMTKHMKNALVCETACAALATLALRNPDHCEKIMQNNGPEVIVRSMQLHPKVAGLQKQGCMVIRNCVARTRQYGPAFLEQGAEAAIQQTMATHQDCKDEAKAALRDLECQVELKCRWTGGGHQLAN